MSPLPATTNLGAGVNAARMLIAGLLALCWMANLAPAAPFDKQIKFTQPDGTVLTLNAKGDEFSAVLRTPEGFTVVHDPALRAYCYAVSGPNGALVSSGQQVHLANPVTLGIQPGLKLSAEARKQMIVERYARWEAAMQTQPRWDALKAARRSSGSGAAFAPPETTGVRVGLTLLVDFSDEAGTVPQAEVVSFLNADNYRGFGNNGSVKSYFYDNSDGQLTYTNIVTVYIRAPQPKSVYADTTKDAGEQGNLLIKEVLDTLKALPDYDTTILPTFDALSVDAFNQVLACNVFYAGDDGGVWSMGLWPHSWSLVVVGAQELSPGGKKVFRYQITNIGNELALGTFCHENGHMLMGYPDIYDYDYDSSGGAGGWCLMNSGGHGKNPSQICAYLKFASGWSRITELDINTSAYAAVTAPMGSNYNHFYRFQKPGTPTEYYLVENRQRQGRDAGIPGSGIAIWHIDELGDRDNQNLNYNNNHLNYEVTLVQADNQWHLQRNINDGDPLDLFYEGNTAAAFSGIFSDDTTPAARWWDGSRSGLYFFGFSSNAPTMTFRAGVGDDSLRVFSQEIVDANRNGIIEVNECTDFYVVLTNVADFTATGIKATLTTTTTNVTIGQRTSPYPNIPSGETGTNLLAFKISTAPEFVCGTPIELTLLIQSDQTVRTNTFRFDTGLRGQPLRFDSFSVVSIPGGDPAGADSGIAVSNLNFAISKVTVSMHLTHSLDRSLTISLIAPDGTTNRLSRHNGGATGRNYGLGCAPDLMRTTFDDDAEMVITAGGPPFVGAYRPEQPLTTFSGKSGTNANGIWKLHVVSDNRFTAGEIQCWSLLLTPASCVDGGGECPGSDLAVGMVAQPDPVFIGNTLVYQIAVTNFGPSAAQNVVLSQVLPAGAIYLSATPSQGSASYAGGVVSCSLGRISAGGRAVVSVSVLPTSTGFVASSATVSSEQPDFDPLNSTASIITQVNPPTADLAVGLTASPTELVVGGAATFVATVTNKGPSAATSVVLTNSLPEGLSVLSATVSQGSAMTAPNLVVCNFGGLTNGQVATVTIIATPVDEGSFVVETLASANQVDPAPINNHATVRVGVGPAADLEIQLVDTPDPVVVGSNLTYTATILNKGPSRASGVVLNQSLDTGVTVSSAVASVGSAVIQGNSVTANLGNLFPGASATVKIVVVPTVKKTLVSSASVSSGTIDPLGDNNTAAQTTLVTDPFVAFAAAGARLQVESRLPANGSLESGETVTAALFLRNSGNVPNTNVLATLLATNGISLTFSNSAQSYGMLLPGDVPTDRTFSFTVAPTNRGPVDVVLRLQEGQMQTNVSFRFVLPGTISFTNANPIVLRDNTTALPYASTINVSGVTGVVGKVAVTLDGISHGYPEDLDAVLVNQAGAKAVLMSGAGAPPLDNAVITFDDFAADILPDTSVQIQSGLYRPASYLPLVAMTPPAPVGPYPASLSVFNSGNPNGTWSLFMADHTPGDKGEVAKGWSIELTVLTPVNKVADLTIAATAAPSTVVASENLTATYTVRNTGPDEASFVAFTNVLPAHVTFVSAQASQGSVSFANNRVAGNLGKLAVGASAKVTVVLNPSPAAAGLLQSSATVSSANEVDLNSINNTAAAVATVRLPAADILISQTAQPTAVIRGSNIVFQATVENAGPEKALNVVVSNTLPAGLTLVSAMSSEGFVAVSGNAWVANLGLLPAGSSAGVVVEAVASTVGAGINTVTVRSDSTDPNPANNSAAVNYAVANPAPRIVAANARLIQESFAPANGAVDPGETVTIALGLENAGSAPTLNLTGALALGGGIINPSGSQSYGAISIGSTVGREFTFTAGDSAVFTATLNLQDGAANLGQVSYQFNAPASYSFTNSAAIVIPNRGAAAPYPSAISVSGVSGVVSKVGVALHGLSHTFARDIHALLVSPAGDSVLLMAHTGGGRAVSGVNLSFSDSAPPLPLSAQITSGVYRPTINSLSGSLPAPAPKLPYASKLEALNGIAPEGKWLLYVFDDSNGDSGSISAGWSLQLTVTDPVNAVSDLSVAMESSPATLYIGSGINHTLTVANRGPADAPNVRVTHELPAGVVFVQGLADQGGFTPSANTVVWQIGTLASGQSVQGTLRVSPSIGLPFVSPMVVVSDGGTDLNPANNSAQSVTTVVTPAAVKVAMAVTPGGVQLTITGQAGQVYAIQASSDLVTWETLSLQAADQDGTIQHLDTQAQGKTARMYRAVRQLP